MLPVRYTTSDPSIGEMFKESFLNTVKEKGLDAAIKVWDESTSTWTKDKELSPKGLSVSNDSSYEKWVPFGPAIRGTYDDYGNIAPLDDEDSQNRVKILENLMYGLPFSTIMDVAQDDRWYTLGLGKYGDTDDKTWRPEGISKDMPDWLISLCKQISITYIHAPVYDELSKFDFSPEERDGIMKNKYEVKWKNEYLDPIKEGLPKLINNLKKVRDSKDLTDAEDPMQTYWENREVLGKISVFRNLTDELSIIYQSAIARQECSLDWFYESLIFMYSLSGMCVKLDRSQYGSQHLNWFGWERVYKALNPILKETLEERGYFEDEEEADA